ncbi:MAG: VTT domain-containing protein [Gemmatimonadetes bacterium]|nr:VTT domain-containing protein [Gemmatimonadota bacterium]
MARTLRERLALVVKLAGLTVPILAGVGLGQLASPYLPGFTAWVNTLGAIAPVAFIVAYIIATVCMLPAFLLTMAGGAIFGIIPGAALVMVGATIGAVIAFTLGRTVLRGWVAARVAQNETLTVIDRVIGEDGLKLMFLIRLSGAAPFVLTNYALGVTTVRLPHFALAMLGMIPTNLAFAAFGRAGVQTGAEKPTWLLAIGITATVVLTVSVTRIAQRAIREAEARRAMRELGT